MKVAVTSRSFSKHPILRAELLERFSDVTFNDDGRSLRGNELVAFLRGHDAAITALETLDADVFASLPELRIVSKYGVGLDMIDRQAMERHGVRLAWSGGVNRRSVAEIVIASAIQLLHRTPAANLEMREGKWRQVVGQQLTAKTVGIIGCGHIGKEVVLLLHGFDCRILANDVLDFPEFYRRHSVRAVSLDELLRASDVVTLHVPLDDSTRNLLSREKIASMKRGAVLINTARGGLVDETALKEVLSDSRLAGAAFDVFAEEPPADRELISLPNFIATPHIGGSSEEAILAMGRAAIAGLVQAAAELEVRP